jgi:hypothetical protein
MIFYHKERKDNKEYGRAVGGMPCCQTCSVDEATPFPSPLDLFGLALRLAS